MSTRKMNTFSNETCLKFYFSTYCPNLLEHLMTHTGHTMRDVTAAISASVVETTHWPGLF